MKTEGFLSDDFLKQFKTADQLNDFLAQIQKRGIVKMLEGELDSHLGYDKHEHNDRANSRNGYGKKKIKTSESYPQTVTFLTKVSHSKPSSF